MALRVCRSARVCSNRLSSRAPAFSWDAPISSSAATAAFRRRCAASLSASASASADRARSPSASAASSFARSLWKRITAKLLPQQGHFTFSSMPL